MDSQSVSVIFVLCCDHKPWPQLQSSNCNKFDFYYSPTRDLYNCEIKAIALLLSKPQSDEMDDKDNTETDETDNQFKPP